MKKAVSIVIALAAIAFLHMLDPSPARAMHITEGILPLPWAVLWFAVAAPFVAWGLYKLKRLSSVDLSFKPLVGFRGRRGQPLTTDNRNEIARGKLVISKAFFFMSTVKG